MSCVNSEGHRAKIGYMNDLEMYPPSVSNRWQPIETCPKVDGVYYLFWSKGDYPNVEVGSYYHSVEMFGDIEVRSINPTHWMPLPEGPK